MTRTDIYTKIIPIVLFLAFISYVVSWIWHSSSETIKTEPVVTDTYSDSVESEGIALRDEEILYASKQFLSIQAEEGKEISKGALLAVSTDSEEELEKTNHLAELTREIHRLENYLSSSASVVDVTSREDSIETSVRKLASAVATRDFSSADAATQDLNAILFLQDTSEKTEAKLNRLKAELESYSDSNSDSAQITAPSAGIFTRSTDGFESLSSEDIQSISVSGLQDLLKQDSTPEEGAYGKLIRSFTWTFLGLVDSSSAERLSPGSSVSLSFSRYYSGTIPAVVVNVSKEDQGQCAVVFSTKYALSDTMAIRHASAEIIFSEVKGLRVPVSSVHVDEDGSTFVYCLTAQTLEAKPVEILSTYDDYYLVRQVSSPDALHEGDSLVVSGKDLYEGKVVSQQS